MTTSSTRGASIFAIFLGIRVLAITKFVGGSMMAIKSIPFRILLNPKLDSDRQLMMALWASHDALNRGVNYYLTQLFMLRRGRGWVRKQGQENKWVENTALIEKVQELYRQRFGTAPTQTEISSIFDDLATVYLQMVPQAAELFNIDDKSKTKATAQKSRGIMDALTNPNSHAFGLRADGKSRGGRKPTRPPKDTAKKDAFKAALYRLEASGCLPLFLPAFRVLNFQSKSGGEWDREMWRQALEKLLSFEGWHARRRTELREWQQKREAWETSYGDTPWYKALRAYEQQRQSEDEVASGHISKKPTFVVPRWLKGWDRILTKWQASKDKSPEHLKRIMIEQQVADPERFGDHRFIEWLAQPEQHFLWVTEDYPTIYAKEHARRRPRSITYTQPDARKHPLWMRWGLNSAVKYKNLDLVKGTVELELLVPIDSGLKREKRVLRFVPIKDVFPPLPDGRAPLGRRDRLTGWRVAKFGGCRLKFNRLDLIRSGVGPENLPAAYLEFTYEVTNDATPAQLFDKTLFKRDIEGYLRQFIGEPERVLPSNELPNGLGVLAVDLGQRHFAAAAVGRIVSGTGTWSMDNNTAYVKTERSFLIDEANDVDPKLTDNMHHFFRQLRLCNLLVQLSGDLVNKDMMSKSRQGRLMAVLQRLMDRQPGDLLPPLPDQINIEIITSADIAEKQAAIQELDDWKIKAHKILAAEYSRFDIALSQRPKKKPWEIPSFKRIEQLELWLRIKRAWTSRPRRAGEQRRLSRGEGFDLALQQHIRNLRDDRVKRGAAELVTSALGYIRNRTTRKLEQINKPCQIIVFEDLFRYRFRQDRPRRENGRLMRWMHRRIVDQTRQQAELYGLRVGLVYSAYTSRFCSRCGAPGIRVKQLSKTDVGSPWLQQYLIELKLSAGIGDIIPIAGGELFLCANPACNVGNNPVNADLNAAFNILHRFFFGTPELTIRVNINGTQATSQTKGGRWKGAVFTAKDRGVWVATAQAKNTKTKAIPEDESDEEETVSGATLFCDPSKSRIFPQDVWLERGRFWGAVETITIKRLSR